MHNILPLAIVILLVLIAGFWFKTRSARVVSTSQIATLADLPEGERNVDVLIKQVYGDAILEEAFVREADGIHVHLTFDTSKTKVKKLNVNLSSLARKQREEGLTDEALKASLKF